MEEKALFENSELAVKMAGFEMPRYDDLPEFPVVMHQLVALLDKYLSVFILPGEEHVLTQPMINSYVYKKIIRAPQNKEYERKQMIHLIAIGVLKNVLPIADIAALIKMQTDQYPINIAYNYLCDEIENAMKITFSTRAFSELRQISKVKTPLSESVRSAVFSSVNQIYVRQSLYFSAKQ